LKNDNAENILRSIDDLTYKELTPRLKSQGLYTLGLKSVLVARLKSPTENDYVKFRRTKRLTNDNAEDVLRSIDDLTYRELRSRLKSQGLYTLGLKSVLVERLKSPNENDIVKYRKKYVIRRITRLKNDNAENILRSIDDLPCIELKSRLKSQGLYMEGCRSVLVTRLKSPTENDYVKFRRIARLKNDDAGLRPIDDLSHIELRARLKSQGLYTSGLKSVLVARLKSPNENDYLKFRRSARLKNDDAGLSPIDDLSCIELRARLRSQGLLILGLKSVLVERLKSANEYDALSVIELRRKLISEGLSSVGDKEILVRRLTSPRKMKKSIDELTAIELRQILISQGLKLTGTREDYMKRLKSPTESDYRANGIVKEITQIPRISSTNDEESEGKQKLFDSLNSRQLRDMLCFRGLMTSGTKSELQKRLLEDGYDADGDDDELYGADKFLKEERKERVFKSLKQLNSSLEETPLKPPLLLNGDLAGKIPEEISGVTNTPLENKFNEDINFQDMRKKRIQRLLEEKFSSSTIAV
jgi:hypothetical protein